LKDPEDWPAWTDERWEPASEPEVEEPEPYQPTDADWADYRQWSEALERRRDYEEAMEFADCLEAREDADRYTDRDLEAAGLPVG
jgi:hypothetical protein